MSNLTFFTIKECSETFWKSVVNCVFSFIFACILLKIIGLENILRTQITNNFQLSLKKHAGCRPLCGKTNPFTTRWLASPPTKKAKITATIRQMLERSIISSIIIFWRIRQERHKKDLFLDPFLWHKKTRSNALNKCLDGWLQIFLKRVIRGRGIGNQGGMSGHQSGEGMVFDPSGGGRRKFCQGGIGGGNKVRFSSGRLWRPKMCRFLLVLAQIFNFLLVLEKIFNFLLVLEQIFNFLLVLEQIFNFLPPSAARGGERQYIWPFLRGGVVFRPSGGGFPPPLSPPYAHVWKGSKSEEKTGNFLCFFGTKNKHCEGKTFGIYLGG